MRFWGIEKQPTGTPLGMLLMQGYLQFIHRFRVDRLPDCVVRVEVAGTSWFLRTPWHGFSRLVSLHSRAMLEMWERVAISRLARTFVSGVSVLCNLRRRDAVDGRFLEVCPQRYADTCIRPDTRSPSRRTPRASALTAASRCSEQDLQFQNRCIYRTAQTLPISTVTC